MQKNFYGVTIENGELCEYISTPFPSAEEALREINERRTLLMSRSAKSEVVTLTRLRELKRYCRCY